MARQLTTFFTHDNGARPFRVELSETDVKLFGIDVAAYSKQVAEEDEEDVYDPQPLLVWPSVSQVWVGRSPLTPMTEYSGDHGPEFDGNSLLLQLHDGSYVFIGDRVKQFRALAPIVEFVSEVGNNDVPYPFARDQEGRYYLLIEDVILTRVPPQPEPFDVYEWYYDRRHLTPDAIHHYQTGHWTRLARTQADQWKQSAPTRSDVLLFFVGTRQHHLTYHPVPEQNFAWLSQPEETDSGVQPLAVVTKTSYPEKQALTLELYTALTTAYGKKMGFQPLVHTLLVPRLCG